MRLNPQVLVGTAIAFAGFYLLTDGLQPEVGDVLSVGAAVAFAAHIVFLSHLAPSPRPRRVHRAPVGCDLCRFPRHRRLQGGFGGSQLGCCRGSAFTGLGAYAGGFLLQIWAQSRVGPTNAAIVLALEPAFAAGTAAIVTGTGFTTSAWIGAGLILVAIFVVLQATTGEPEVAKEATSPH